jgi:antirestriction protein
VIEAYLVNLGWLNAGIAHGEPLRFPADFETVQSRLRKINGLDGRHDIALSDYRADIPGLAKCLSPYENLDELNYLAHLLQGMESYDRAKFAAAVEHGEYSGTVEDLINLAWNLDCYNLYTGVRSTEDLGRLRSEGRLNLPDDCRFYFDYAAYGEDVSINEGGVFSNAGYIHNNRSSFITHYDGRQVPEEYRVLAAPAPPEKMPIKDQLAMYEKMAGAGHSKERHAPDRPDR